MVSDKGKRQTDLLFLILVGWCTCTNPGWISMISPLQSDSLEFFIPTEAQHWPVQDMLGSRMEKKSQQHYACISVGRQHSFSSSVLQQTQKPFLPAPFPANGALARSSWLRATTWALLDLELAPWQIKIGLELQPSRVSGEGAASLAC